MKTKKRLHIQLLLLGIGWMILSLDLKAGPGPHPAGAPLLPGTLSGTGCSNFAANQQNEPPRNDGAAFLFDNRISGGLPDNEPLGYSHPEQKDIPGNPEAMIRTAISLNPAVRIASQQAWAAQGTFDAAKGEYAPTITGNAGVKTGYAQKPDFPGHARTWTVDYVPQIQSTWLLADLGGREGRVGQARFNLLAADYGINQSLQKVVLSVLVNYYTWLEKRQAADALARSDSNLLDAVFAWENNEQPPEIRQPPRGEPPCPLHSRNFAALITGPTALFALPPGGTTTSVHTFSSPKLAEASKLAGSSMLVEMFQNFTRSIQNQAMTLQASDILQYQAAIAAEQNARIQLVSSIGYPADVELPWITFEDTQDLKTPDSVPDGANGPSAYKLGSNDLLEKTGSSPDQIPPLAKKLSKILLPVAFRQRPDLAAVYSLYKSAQYSARAANSAIYPTLTTTFSTVIDDGDSIKHTDDPGVASNKKFSQNVGRSDGVMAAISVNVPIFDGFTLVNKARSARSAEQVAKATLDNAELAAVTDIETDLVTYLYAVNQYKQARIALCLAKQTYIAEQQKFFISGTAQMTTQMAVEAARIQNSNSEFNALYQAHIASESAEQTFFQDKLAVRAGALQLSNAIGALLPSTIPYKNNWSFVEPIGQIASLIDFLNKSNNADIAPCDVIAHLTDQAQYLKSPRHR